MKGRERRAGRRAIVREWLRIAAGLLVFAFGVHLTIFANLGLAPWDCLGMGIARHTPLNYGLAMTFIGVTVLGVDRHADQHIRRRGGDAGDIQPAGIRAAGGAPPRVDRDHSRPAGRSVTDGENGGRICEVYGLPWCGGPAIGI